MIYLLLVAGAFLFPKRPVELGKLIPVELILVEQKEGAYLVRTDTGDMGRGATLQSAIENLHATAAGDLFLDTARYLLVTEETQHAIPEISVYLKGKTYLGMVENGLDPERATQYLSAHPPKLQLKDWKTGSKPEFLQQIEGRYSFE
jgi:hypothetical protein